MRKSRKDIIVSVIELWKVILVESPEDLYVVAARLGQRLPIPTEATYAYVTVTDPETDPYPLFVRVYPTDDDARRGLARWCMSRMMEAEHPPWKAGEGNVVDRDSIVRRESAPPSGGG